MQRSKAEAAHRTSMYLYNAGNAYDVDIGKFEYWRALNPNSIGGALMRIWEENAIGANAGVRGTLGAGRFDWDASLSISRDEMKSSWKQLITDRVHRYLFGERIGTIDGDPLYDIDPTVLFGTVSPEQYAAMTDTIRNKNLSQTYRRRSSCSAGRCSHCRRATWKWLQCSKHPTPSTSCAGCAQHQYL